jgi:hypothetical protein
MRRQVRGERTVRRAYPRAAAGCSLRYGSLRSPPLREHPAAAIPLLSQHMNLVACVTYVLARFVTHLLARCPPLPSPDGRGRTIWLVSCDAEAANGECADG